MDTRAIGIAEFVGGAAVLALAAFVASTTRGRPANRLLAILFAVDGLGQIVWGVHDFLNGRGALAERAMQLGILSIALSTLLYLLLARRLATPLARPLRSPLVLTAFGLLVLGSGIGAAAYILLHPGAIDIPNGTMDPAIRPYMGAFGVGMLLGYAYALVAAISAWRRAPSGTTMRKSAGAFALAFGARDVLIVAAIALNVLASFVVGATEQTLLAYALWPASTIVYAALLAYGLLRLQLFDLDLRLKWGISRGTVAGIILVGVFVGAKIVESYLNRTAGFVAGSVVAGVLLFLVPKLNKVGEKVANTALPQVQPTSEYLIFKKLEVYKAAVESALESGGEIDGNERRMLDRLREKLGLSEGDARAMEAELTAGA